MQTRQHTGARLARSGATKAIKLSPSRSRRFTDPRTDWPFVYLRCNHDNTQALDWREVAPQKPSNSPLLGRVVLLIQELIGLSFIYVATMAVWQRPSLATFGFFLYAIWFNPGQNYVLYAEAQRLPLLAVGLEAVQVAERKSTRLN